MCAAIQRNLNKLEDWNNGNRLKFSTGKCQVLHLGKSSPMHLYSLGADQLESSSAEKFVGVLVDTKFTVSSNVPLQQRGPTAYWIALGRALPAH